MIKGMQPEPFRLPFHLGNKCKIDIENIYARVIFLDEVDFRTANAFDRRYLNFPGLVVWLAGLAPDRSARS